MIIIDKNYNKALYNKNNYYSAINQWEKQGNIKNTLQYTIHDMKTIYN